VVVGEKPTLVEAALASEHGNAGKLKIGPLDLRRF